MAVVTMATMARHAKANFAVLVFRLKMKSKQIRFMKQKQETDE
jgi:hypothetical protein